MTTLQNFFLKSKYKVNYGADVVRPDNSEDPTDYRLMKDTFVASYKKYHFENIVGPGSDIHTGIIKDLSEYRFSKTIDGMNLLEITHEIMHEPASDQSSV